MVITHPPSPTRLDLIPPAAAGAAVAAGVVAVLLAGGDGRAGPGPWATIVPAVVALGTAAMVRRGRSPAPMAALSGLLLSGVALLVAETPRGTITVVLALTAGLAAGLAAAVPLRPPGVAVAAAVAVGASALGVAAVAGRIDGLWMVAFWGIVVCGLGLLSWQGRPPRPAGQPAMLGVGGLAVGLVVLLTAWVAANDPTVGWFGGRSHGPRDRPEVALTFDDGPDDTYTMAVRDVLDRYGVKGTFFEVGQAVDARPDLTRALYDDGHLVANHSYHHDSWRWLDPRYPELARTQTAIRRATGVCPGLFRPPHGQRTPFMAAAVDDRAMTMVTWDASGQDWSLHDPVVVSRLILAKVRPGSIILLHDGLDGKVHADRSVLVAALPLIIDGLRARGLQPVRLDQLLAVAPYVPC
jgi:peptidoglycan/xylan/chitin deacetylase (PgdA/CDA1 family)